MIKQADNMRKQDMMKKELISIRNEGETLIYDTRKMVGENKENISKETIEKVNKDIENIQALLNTDNLGEIKNAVDNLRNSSMQIGKEIYSKVNSDKK
jgi:molecular chaperone DnaK